MKKFLILSTEDWTEKVDAPLSGVVNEAAIVRHLSRISKTPGDLRDFDPIWVYGYDTQEEQAEAFENGTVGMPDWEISGEVVANAIDHGKIPYLVSCSLMTRVEANIDATDEEVIRAAKAGFIEKIKDDLGDNIEEVWVDWECPEISQKTSTEQEQGKDKPKEYLNGFTGRPGNLPESTGRTFSPLK